ncbi:MAG: hypothetical protein IKL87_05905, partial [Oscillospiraceae bacterium]|nr:hypothetical protein [Oscillospiraceae bacterium]
MLCRNASWIWENDAPQPDEYADFLSVFCYQGGKTELEISCDSNYAAFVNGKLAAFGQYADYPHYKVADTIDISAFCHEGENTLLITVWYYGDNSSVYTVGQAGVIYEVVADGVSAAHSGPAALCRVSPCYV